MIINPAKTLFEYLNGIVIINDPELNQLNRLSDNRKQLWILSNSNNMFCSNKQDLIFDINFETAFKGLADEIINFDKNLKFNLMTLPLKAIESASLNVVNKVIVRMIEYYEIIIDEILTRYDILIEKVS